MRIVHAHKDRQTTQYEYWERDETTRSFIVDSEESPPSDIIDEFRAQFKNFAKKKKAEKSVTATMPEISGYNDYRKLGIDKINFVGKPSAPAKRSWSFW